jgi:DNA-binding IclR family transcriptional regulator
MSVVTPFARALALLDAFTPLDHWLSSRELSARCGVPASTTWRIAQSLVIAGYLLHDAGARKYRLAASVLALGYGAVRHGGLPRSMRERMQEYADLQSVHISLGTRDRLEIVAIASCRPVRSLPDLPVPATRVGLSSSPMGWALLSALPESERGYLMHNAARRVPQDGVRLRRRLIQAAAQVRERGYCSSVSDWDRDLGIVSTPVSMQGRAPCVISCIGAAGRFTIARVQRELGPRLLALAAVIQGSVGNE